MITLALSTSTPRGSAALLDGERLLATAAYVDLQGHAERIFHAIDDALAAAAIPRAAIEALACDIGPGSFTGVRVAVAAAKGIALALRIPIAGVTSLEAMAAAAFARGAAGPGDVVIAALDAKKDELYLAAFDAPGAPPCLTPRHVRRAAASEALECLEAGRRVVVAGEIGEQVAVLRPLVARGAAHDLPDAVWIGRVAAGAAAREPALLEPLYVRAPL